METPVTKHSVSWAFQFTGPVYTDKAELGLGKIVVTLILFCLEKENGLGQNLAKSRGFTVECT